LNFSINFIPLGGFKQILKIPPLAIRRLEEFFDPSYYEKMDQPSEITVHVLISNNYYFLMIPL